MENSKSTSIKNTHFINYSLTSIIITIKRISYCIIYSGIIHNNAGLIVNSTIVTEIQKWRRVFHNWNTPPPSSTRLIFPLSSALAHSTVSHLHTPHLSMPHPWPHMSCRGAIREYSLITPNTAVSSSTAVQRVLQNRHAMHPSPPSHTSSSPTFRLRSPRLMCPSCAHRCITREYSLIIHHTPPFDYCVIATKRPPLPPRGASFPTVTQHFHPYRQAILNPSRKSIATLLGNIP